MKFEINDVIQILGTTPEVMKSQLYGLNKEWLMGNEGEGTWNPAEIICHMIHCEEVDWIPRMNIVLSSDENKKFEPLNRTFGFEKIRLQTINQLLDEFKKLREINLKYLGSVRLTEDQLIKKGIHPEFGEVTLKQLLAAWVVHDLSHIAQISRVLAMQYYDEVGPWTKYLPILTQSSF